MSDPPRTLGVQQGLSVGLATAMGGLAAIVLSWILGFRALRTLGLAAVVAGGGLYARARLDERHEKIEAAESHIRSELDELDPVARAQVLADIARHPKT